MFKRLINRINELFVAPRYPPPTEAPIVDRLAVESTVEAIRHTTPFLRPNESYSVKTVVPVGLKPEDTTKNVLDLVADLTARIDFDSQEKPGCVVFTCRIKPVAKQPR